jgi:hypothetical protein
MAGLVMTYLLGWPQRRPKLSLFTVTLDGVWIDGRFVRREDVWYVPGGFATPFGIHGYARPLWPPTTSDESVVARRGRSIGAWRDALTRVVDSEGGYRTPAVAPPDVPIELLEAPELETRIGAALALADPSNPSRVARILAIAAGHSTDLSRRVLEGIAVGQVDEHLIEAALRGQR